VAKKASSRKRPSGKGGSAGKAASAAKSGTRTATKRSKASSASRGGVSKTAAAKGPLTKRDLGMFRRMLLEKRREIVGDMSGIEAEALKTDRDESKGDISDHPADAGTDNFEQEFSLGLLESERVILGEIDEALGRLDEGTYGVCLGTGKPIGKPRLKARPWAKYCIDYARMIEKGLVRPGDEDED